MTDDLISRKGTFELMEEMFCKPCSETRNLYNGVVCRACRIDDAMSAVEMVESATPWIPVHERLPKKKSTVLITNSKGNVRCGQYRGLDREDPRFWIWKGNRVEQVKAWMPMPEKYEFGELME